MMKLDSISPAGANSQHQPSGGEKVERVRKERELSVEPEKGQNQVPSEEILDKIKDLTEGGLHSVRFEMNEPTSKLIVKIFNDSDELIRQIPAEELLSVSKNLQDYRGLILDGQG